MKEMQLLLGNAEFQRMLNVFRWAHHSKEARSEALFSVGAQISTIFGVAVRLHMQYDMLSIASNKLRDDSMMMVYPTHHTKLVADQYKMLDHSFAVCRENSFYSADVFESGAKDFYERYIRVASPSKDAEGGEQAQGRALH